MTDDGHLHFDDSQVVRFLDLESAFDPADFCKAPTSGTGSAAPSTAAATLEDISSHMNNGLMGAHKHLRSAQMAVAVQPVVADWPKKLGPDEQRAVLADANVASFLRRFNYPLLAR